MWSPPPESLEVACGVVHVWRAALDIPPELLVRFSDHLAEDERSRAARFVFPRDRGRFIVARGVLRDMLGRYLELPPTEIRFSYGESGKPELAPDLSGSSLRFNLAHSRDVALYAFTLGREVGIDVEFVRSELATEEIAERFFSQREAAELRALPASEQPRAFFRCWTRKEAYIKARGRGFRIPLGSFEVSLASGEPARLLAVHDDPFEAARWSLCDIPAGLDYQAALAVEGETPDVLLFDWHSSK
jgi:4'-phosphopantetheinyl transferase